MSKDKRKDLGKDPTTGEELVPFDPMAMMESHQGTEMFLPASDWATLAEEGDFTEELFIGSIPEGKVLVGKLVGKGSEVMMSDPADPGKLRPVPTWRIRLTNRITGVIIGASQIDARLSGFKAGDIIAIGRVGTAKTRKGTNVNTYRIMSRPDDPKVPFIKDDEPYGAQESAKG